jgi:hypothetical protein
VLSALGSEGPAQNDAVLAGAGNAADLGGEPAEHDDAATDDAGRIRAGAVERRPDELFSDGVLARHPDTGDDPVAQRAGVDVQAVVLRPRVPADEAVRERRLDVGALRVDGLLPRRRRRRVELDLSRREFGNDGVAGEDATSWTCSLTPSGGGSRSVTSTGPSRWAAINPQE